MLQVVVQALARVIKGTTAAIRARPKVFLLAAVTIFVLNLFLPPLVLSLARKPWDLFSFNPWLSRLPEWLTSGDVPLARKLEFLRTLALFWFIAENPIEGVEWGFVVDVGDLLRFLFTSLLFGAYFALWFYRRDQVVRLRWGERAGQHGAVAGGLTCALGLSTGPCSVIGCGVPVLPVIALAFTGLSTSTLKLLGELSRVATAVVLFAMTLAVVYLGWRVGADPSARGSTPS